LTKEKAVFDGLLKTFIYPVIFAGIGPATTITKLVCACSLFEKFLYILNSGLGNIAECFVS
jgi:hypothetical protein